MRQQDALPHGAAIPVGTVDKGERQKGALGYSLDFLCTFGFRETPNLEADMYLAYSGASVLNWGGGAW
jgi:hypothetical protein